MTGIERLRELAGDYKNLSTKQAYVGINTRREADLLSDIADQIERERACDADTIENVRLIVGGVVDDMERHVSGVEGMEDSPVARWARELREALGGEEHDHADEREIIAWVREHGGLDSVKKLLGWVVGHCSTRQQLDFDFWLSGRVMHELGFEEDMADRDEVERRLLARLNQRPVLAADGRPLREGEMVYSTESGDEFTVIGIDAKSGDVHIRWGYDFEDKTGMIAAELLTHERPDSWERLEEDATVSPEAYCVKRGIDFSDVDGQHRVLDEVTERMARDLVRRAKKLAERGQ